MRKMIMHTFLQRTMKAVVKPMMAVVSTTRAQIPCSYLHSASTRSKQYNRPPVIGLDLPDVWTTQKDGPASSSSFSSCQGHDDASTLLHTTIIDGSSIAEEIRADIADEVCKMKDSIGKVPGLAVVLVGSRKDSETYVRNKIKACSEVGIRSFAAELHEDCTEEEVFSAVSRFNDDPAVHGVLVQLPLPKHMNEENVLSAIRVEKDVDGFHPLNMGYLAMRSREPLFIPCTPKGCIELLLRSGIDIMGKKAVVIGRSNVVGLPTFLLLQRHHATVSIVHAFTENPEEVTREADILISAAGVANLVRREWLKPGAVVIDVGTNPVETSLWSYNRIQAVRGATA
ncbi:unnamed protein product [Victoria cruziana]